jgi:hypothetical protein
VLDVPVTFFFEGISTTSTTAPATYTTEYTDPLSAPEATELAAAYHSISDQAMRRRLLDLARALGTGPSEATASARQSGVRADRRVGVLIERGTGKNRRYTPGSRRSGSTGRPNA